MAKNNGNAAAQNPPADRFDEETELSNFPPYWTPEVGSVGSFIVDAFDRRDPDFPRIYLQYTGDEPLECFRGAGEEAESVPVQKGEMCSTSVFAGLAGLEEYIGLEVRIRCEGTRPTGQPNDMFIFKIGTTKETRALLAERRANRAMPAGPPPAAAMPSAPARQSFARG